MEATIKSVLQRKPLEAYEDNDHEIIPVPESGKGPKKRVRHKNRSRQEMELEVPLSKSELLEKKVEHYKLFAEAEDIRSQLEKTRKSMKPLQKKLNGLTSDIRKQATSIALEKEVRNVTVEILADVHANVATIYYEGKPIKEMPLRELKKLKEERVNAAKDAAQIDLFEGRKARGAAAKR